MTWTLKLVVAVFVMALLFRIDKQGRVQRKKLYGGDVF